MDRVGLGERPMGVRFAIETPSPNPPSGDEGRVTVRPVVTAAGARGFEPIPQLRADMFFLNGVRLPYQKFNRQPNINPYGSAQLGSPLLNRT